MKKTKEIVNKKRKICFVITSPIHYSRNIFVLEELNKRPDVDLHVVVSGSALLSKYLSKFSDIETLLRNDGIKNIYEAYFYLDGDKPVCKAKTTGLGVIEFSSVFNDMKPDVVVVRGDRFEVLAASIAATYLNIPIAHIEGGDLSGTIDESVRHSITKIAHIHFTTNEPSKERVIRMGENPEYVFNYGSPDVEVVGRLSTKKEEIIHETGSGHLVDYNKPYLMVMYHPVTTELSKIRENTKQLIGAIKEIDMPTVWFWPNVDTGSEEIAHELRRFRDENPDNKVRFMRYLPPKMFLSVLGGASVLVGNSSAGIKECSYLGKPVVNLGTRQNSRLKADNVVDVSCDRGKIVKAIRNQLKIGKYKPSKIYSIKDTGKKIARTLATVPLYIQKKFCE